MSAWQDFYPLKRYLWVFLWGWSHRFFFFLRWEHHPECGQHHSVVWDPRLKEEESISGEMTQVGRTLFLRSARLGHLHGGRCLSWLVQGSSRRCWTELPRFNFSFLVSETLVHITSCFPLQPGGQQGQSLRKELATSPCNLIAGLSSSSAEVTACRWLHCFSVSELWTRLLSSFFSPKNQQCFSLHTVWTEKLLMLFVCKQCLPHAIQYLPVVT